MKIALKEVHEKYHGGDKRTLYVPWRESAPFVLNPRGILVHRVLGVTTIIRHYWEEDTNVVVKYACWNGCSFDCEKSDVCLLHEVPGDRILCERCEQVALNNGLPSADELCGRHVHVGRVRAIRSCCKELEQ